MSTKQLLSSPSDSASDLIRMRRFAQITVPESFRERFDVKEGDYIKMELKPWGMALKPVSVISHDHAWDDIFSSMKEVKPSTIMHKKSPLTQEESLAREIKTERKKKQK